MYRGPGIRRLTAEQYRDAVATHRRLASEIGVRLLRGGVVRASLVPGDAPTTALGRPIRQQVVTTRATVATTLQGLELMATVIPWLGLSPKVLKA